MIVTPLNFITCWNLEKSLMTLEGRYETVNTVPGTCENHGFVPFSRAKLYVSQVFNSVSKRSLCTILWIKSEEQSQLREDYIVLCTCVVILK